jgi:hypothetical protein
VIDPITPSTLYAGGSGVYKTVDDGDLWSPTSIGLPTDSNIVVSLGIDPVTPTTLYAGTENSGLFIKYKRRTELGCS